jgi:outer membrane protein assembly factor BamA
VGGSSLGLSSSLQKPYDNILRISSDYDFNGKNFESKLGYEFDHVFNTQTALGFEVFDREASKEGQDLSGGKIYLRRELWPASYDLFDLNDHVTFYVIRDQKLESVSTLSGKEYISDLYYRRKDEAILGVTGSLGRYGPYPDPDYGWKFLPTLEYAGHFLGGNESFWRSTFELNNYRLVLPKYQLKLASRIKAGWGEHSDKKLFQLGGPDGLRGYSRKTIEGSHMILGSLEYRLPLKSDIKFYFLDNILCLDQIQSVLFFDLGRAWYANFDSASFKKDAGLGFRFHFNIIGFLEKVVLRVDIAQAIGEPKEKTHFWLGLNHAF